MTTHTDTQQEKKRTSSTPAGDLAARLDPRAILEASSAFTPAQAWRQALTIQSECARFGARRAQRYETLFRELGACETPMDAMQLCAQAAYTTVQDYVDEAAQMSDLSREAMASMTASQTKNSKR